jgi:hypothetical protein
LALAKAPLPALDLTINNQFDIGAFYGASFFRVNVLAVMLQAFVASRLVKFFGLGGVLFWDVGNSLQGDKAEALKLTAQDLLKLEVVDEIVPERPVCA